MDAGPEASPGARTAATAGPARPGVRIGRVLGVPVYLAPSWFVFAFVVVVTYGPALSAAAGEGSGWGGAGSFAVLLGLSVLLHEIGHCVVARAFGLPVRSITVTFLAGFTEITESPQTPLREYAVAVAGPMVSLVLAGVGFATAPLAGGLTHVVLEGVALTNAVVAGFNMLPGLPLDGGRVLRAALWRLTGDPGRATVASAWSGRVLGVVVVPLVLLVVLPATGAWSRDGSSVVFALLLSVFIYSGATSALRRGQVARRVPVLSAAALARPAVAVRADTPVAEAVRQAGLACAGGVVVVDAADRVEGVLSEAAVAATPGPRRPWVVAGALARTAREDEVLPYGIGGEELLEAMRAGPATEYVLRDEGSRLWVLSADDVARALGGRR